MSLVAGEAAIAHSQRRTASAPFDNPNADLIIRTSDHVNFGVHRIILIEASPVFKDMLSPPQEHGPDGNVVEVSEGWETWDLILRMCYPIARTEAITKHDLLALLEAARKYDMDCVRETVKQAMLSPPMLEREPVRVYFLACAFSFHSVAAAAARASLRHRLELGAPLPCIAELGGSSADVYHRLVRYRWECMKAATSFAEDPFVCEKEEWLNLTAWAHRIHVMRSSCTSALSFYSLHPQYFFVDYMRRTLDALKVQPVGLAVATSAMISPTVEAASTCDTCRKNACEDITRFAEFYCREVEAVVSKVELQWDLKIEVAKGESGAIRTSSGWADGAALQV